MWCTVAQMRMPAADIAGESAYIMATHDCTALFDEQTENMFKHMHVSPYTTPQSTFTLMATLDPTLAHVYLKPISPPRFGP
jgi:hypothetical protein